VSPSELTARRAAWLVVALTVLGALLRFPRLGHQSLWLDELYTRWLAGLEFRQMLDEIPRSERTPYLFYVVEWATAKLTGSSEAGLRALSAVAGTLTIPCAYAAGTRLVSRRSGLVVALLVTVNPLLGWYSQEARAYALVTLLLTAGLACWASAREGSGVALAGWALLSALAIATHYFAAFVVVPEAVWLVWTARSRWQAGIAVAVPLAMLAAISPLAREQSGGGVDLGGDPLGRRLAGAAKDFVVGYSFPHERLGSLAAFGLVVVGIVLAPRLCGQERRGAVAAATLGVVALAIPVVLALAGIDYVVPRNLIVALVPLLVALAAAYTTSRAGLVAAGLLAVLSLGLVLAVQSDLRYGRSDWRGAAAALPADGRPRALVVSPTVRTDLVQPYLPGVEAITAPVKVRSIAVASLATQGGLTSGAVVPPAASTTHIPPGFEVTETRTTPTYSLVVLSAGRPRVVTPAELDRLRFTDDPARLFLQP